MVVWSCTNMFLIIQVANVNGDLCTYVCSLELLGCRKCRISWILAIHANCWMSLRLITRVPTVHMTYRLILICVFYKVKKMKKPAENSTNNHGNHTNMFQSYHDSRTADKERVCLWPTNIADFAEYASMINAPQTMLTLRGIYFLFSVPS